MNQIMGDCGGKGRAEVYKEHSDLSIWLLQVRQDCMKCNGDSILCRSVRLVGKLVAIQVYRDIVFDVGQYDPLKEFHDDWGEGDRTVVSRLLGTGTMVVDLRQVGTATCCTESLKISVNTLFSWAAQVLSVRPDTLSSPVRSSFNQGLETP